jgi:hypothetical protein
MVRIRLTLRKTIEENAVTYFEAAKKAKRKLEGTTTTLARFEKELPASKAKATAVRHQKKEWYEQYRWTFTSDGVLIIAGKDATSNESIVKKHAEPTDMVLHTEAAGSPFTILKGEATPQRLSEAAQFCAAYSRAWKNGLASTTAFAVQPEQLSKTANTGEFIGKGSFMVRGEKQQFTVPVSIALGIIDGKPMSGVPQLFIERGALHAVLAPGKEKVSDIAKKLAKKLNTSPDDWLGLIPAGGAIITSWKKPATMHKNTDPEETT